MRGVVVTYGSKRQAVEVHTASKIEYLSFNFRNYFLHSVFFLSPTALSHLGRKRTYIIEQQGSLTHIHRIPKHRYPYSPPFLTRRLFQQHQSRPHHYTCHSGHRLGASMYTLTPPYLPHSRHCRGHSHHTRLVYANLGSYKTSTAAQHQSR